MARDARRQTSPARTGGWSAGTSVLLIVAVLGALSAALSVHSRWSGSSPQIAVRPAETGAAVEGRAALTGDSSGHRLEPARIRSDAPLPALKRAAEPEVLSTDESLAPCDATFTEEPVLQALDEPDDETRYQRLLETLGSGAEVPVARMREALATDPSDKVRELALIALIQHPDATVDEIRATAEGSLANASLAVRTHAARVLEELNQEMNALEAGDQESLAIQSAM